MKRTYYNAVLTLKQTFNGIYKYTFKNYKKIKYEINGENVKLYLYSRNGSIEIVEYANVISVKVTKYRA